MRDLGKNTGDTTGDTSSFERETAHAIAGVRDIFARIIELRCPKSKAVTAVCDAFGIHRKLAWQVSKVAYAENPFAAVSHMPSKKGVALWLGAASAKGLPADLLDAALAAERRLASITEKHAASRTELDMLLESCGSGRDVEAEAKWRHQAFVGNSYTWGVHCHVLLAICVLLPSDDRAHHFHVAQVRGLIDYRQTRPGVRWIVNQAASANDESAIVKDLQRTPLDPEAAARHDGVPVLPSFCSDPLPALTRRIAPDGIVYDEIISGPVGQTGERTLVTGELVRNLGLVHATAHDTVAHFGTAVRIPAERLHFDMFVRRGLFGDVQRELCVFSDLASAISFDDSDALAVADEIACLGRGVSLAHTPSIPGYADLAASVFEKLNVHSDDYDLYRITMAYPPMPTTVMIRHDLMLPSLLDAAGDG